MNILQQKIESLLFYKNEPLRHSWLSKALHVSVDDIKKALDDMHSYYTDRGIVLVSTGYSVSLMTSPIGSEVLASLSKKDDAKDLSKQALETLAIILYSGQITKSEIDFIRGVNSVFILRNLLIRGLVQKNNNPTDKRSPLYTTTHATLSFLGITHKKDLPNINSYSKKLAELAQDYQAEQTLEIGNKPETQE